MRITAEWPALPEPTLTLRTRLPGTPDPLRHRVRVPLDSGGFTRRGALLLKSEVLRSTELGDCAAVSGGGDGMPAELVAQVHSPDQPIISLIDRRGFIDELPLHRLRRLILRQFGTLGTQDALARLTVERDGVLSRHIEVGLYGCSLKVDRQTGLCTMRREYGQLPVESLEFAARSLTEPTMPLVQLAEVGGAMWRLLGPDTPDTWLIIGSGVSCGMVRPLVWVSGQPADLGNRLARTAAVEDFDARQIAFEASLDTITGARSTAIRDDLTYLLSVIRQARRFGVPALSLDVLRAVARHRMAPLLLLFNADEASKQDIVELEDELPFLWCMTDPAALFGFTLDLIRVLRDIGLDEVAVREAAAAKLADIAERCPQLGAACWLAREGSGLPHAPNQPSLDQLRNPEIRKILHDGCDMRRMSDENWRLGLAEAREWQNLDADVRADAPLFAARLVAARTPAASL